MLGQPCISQKVRPAAQRTQSAGGLLPIGWVSSEGEAMFVTESMEMGIGAHTETLSFIVAPGMEQPLVLGLAWLLK